MKKCSLELNWKKFDFQKIYFPITFICKEHNKIVKICMVKFDVTVLDRPKIMGVLWIKDKYI